MFSVGDIVMKDFQGACQITDIVQMSFQGNMTKYYVLFPFFRNKQMKIMIPENVANTKLRYPIKESMAKEIIEEVLMKDFKWINDNKERKTCFEEIIASSNLTQIGLLYKLIRTKDTELRKNKKSLSLSDSNIYQSVKILFFEELSVSLNKTIEEMSLFFDDKLTIA